MNRAPLRELREEGGGGGGGGGRREVNAGRTETSARRLCHTCLAVFGVTDEDAGGRRSIKNRRLLFV